MVSAPVLIQFILLLHVITAHAELGEHVRIHPKHRDDKYYSGGNDIKNELNALDKQIDELDNGKRQNSENNIKTKIDRLEKNINKMEHEGSVKRVSNSNDNQKYSDKSQVTAYLLSIVFGGVAAGRFYVGYYELGLLKLVCGFIAICGLCTCLCSMCNWWTASTMQREYKPWHYWCCCLWILIFIIYVFWWIIDGIMFARNEIPDPETGLALRPWHCIFGYDCLFEK